MKDVVPAVSDGLAASVAASALTPTRTSGRDTTGVALKTSGGPTIYGTFLASKGSIAPASGFVYGKIVGGGDISLVSGSQVHLESFAPVPEPSTLLLLGFGLAGLGGIAGRRQRQR